MRSVWIILVTLILASCASSPTTESTSDEGQELATTYKNMGIAYMRRGEIERAQERLEKSHSLNENDPDTVHLLAEVYHRLGNTEQAALFYEQALALQPNDPNFLNNYAGFLCTQQRYDEAEQIFIDIASRPNYDTPHFAYENAGRCVLRQDAQDKAEDYFSKALRIQPKLPISLFHMAELKFAKGEYFKARAYFERYLEVGQETPALLLLGYQIEKQLGADEMAAQYAEKLVKHYRDSEQTATLRAMQEDEAQGME